MILIHEDEDLRCREDSFKDDGGMQWNPFFLDLTGPRKIENEPDVSISDWSSHEVGTTRAGWLSVAKKKHCQWIATNLMQWVDHHSLSLTEELQDFTLDQNLSFYLGTSVEMSTRQKDRSTNDNFI